MAPPPIYTLPNELLDKVTIRLENGDLLNLRLTSTHLRNATFPAFQDTFFLERSHLFTETSLQVLASITANPHLTSKLKKITFVVSCSNQILCPGDEGYEDWLQPNFPRENIPSEKLPLSREEKEELGAKWVPLREAVKKSAIVLLPQCLSNLRGSGIYPALAVHRHLLPTNCDEYANAYGNRELLDMVKPCNEPRYIVSTLQCLPHTDFAISALFKAIGVTLFPVSDLSIPGNFSETAEFEYGLSFTEKHRMLYSFKHLKRLEVTDDGPGNSSPYRIHPSVPTAYRSMPRRMGKVLREIVTAAESSLTDVKLDNIVTNILAGHLDRKFMADLFARCSLERLEVHGFSFEKNVVLKMLQHHGSTLKYLKLQHHRCYIDRRVVAHIHNHMTLQELDLEDLHGTGFFPKPWPKYHFEGAEEIRKGLSELLEVPVKEGEHWPI